MKKQYLKSIIVFIILILALTACGSNNTNDDIKIENLEETLGQELLDNVTFQDKIESVDENVIETMYGISKDQYTAAKVYMSTGATAEEIAIFRVDTDDNQDAIKKAMETRVEDQKTIMQDYLPDEMAKLENAIIQVKDHYVILCITDDLKNAQKIVDKYF